MIYARQPDGRVLVDREMLATSTGRAAGTIRSHCTPTHGELYDLDHARAALAILPPLPTGPAVALTAAEAQRWLAIPAGTVRSWASRGDLLPTGWRGRRPVYAASQLLDLLTQTENERRDPTQHDDRTSEPALALHS